MTEVSVVVGGLEIPQTLVAAIASGRWRVPETSKLIDVFADEPQLPEFYDLASIERQNASWHAFELGDVWGHVSDGSIGVDPKRSLVIADLGPDMPIALDYRISSSSPSVIYLRYQATPVWTLVADSIDDVLARLNL